MSARPRPATAPRRSPRSGDAIVNPEDAWDVPDANPVRGVPRARVEGDDRVGPGSVVDITPRWAEGLVRLLDDGVRVPFTNFRFGLDPILGAFLPGVGDAATGLGSFALLLLALREGVPTVAIGRMVLNIAIDTVFGSVPVVGDLFDAFFKSNRRNLALIERYRDEPDAQPSPLDYVLVVGGMLLVLLGIAIPFLVVWLIARGLS